MYTVIFRFSFTKKWTQFRKKMNRCRHWRNWASKWPITTAFTCLTMKAKKLIISYLFVPECVTHITNLSGYPRSNVKTRLEQSNYYLASGRFQLQNAIYDNKLPFSRM